MPHALAFLDSLGGPEILVIGVIALLMFGAKRLPEVGRGLGRAIREFKRATSGVEDNLRDIMRDEPTPTIRPPLHQGPPRNQAYPLNLPAGETPALEAHPPSPTEPPAATSSDSSSGQLSFGEHFDSAHQDTAHPAASQDAPHHDSTGNAPPHDGNASSGNSHDSGSSVPPHS